ncbi:hypothetical protein [Silvanigrella sp.]|jgi:hypothetical protein|uniref:hypothetical protein n=1 Tax=Silvanigrella sp. TaxID=2024976 RepID=UPI0037CB7574
MKLKSILTLFSIAIISTSIISCKGKDGEDGKKIFEKEVPVYIPPKNGQDGKDGLNGRDGKDGLNGKDGVDGLNGVNGIDGLNGKDGKDGISYSEFLDLKNSLEALSLKVNAFDPPTFSAPENTNKEEIEVRNEMHRNLLDLRTELQTAIRKSKESTTLEQSEKLAQLSGSLERVTETLNSLIDMVTSSDYLSKYATLDRVKTIEEHLRTAINAINILKNPEKAKCFSKKPEDKQFKYSEECTKLMQDVVNDRNKKPIPNLPENEV